MVAGAAEAHTQAVPATGRRAAVERLLERRARALVAGNERAFMATVSDHDPTFAARQRASFRALTALGLASFELTPDWDAYGDLARPRDLRRYEGARDIAVLPVGEEYRIAGAGAGAPGTHYYTFVKARDGWRIASDSDLAGFGLRSARHLWDFGPVGATHSRHFTLLQHPCGVSPGCAGLGADFLALAEEALDRVDRFWRAPWSRRVVIVAPSGPNELADLLDVTFDVAGFVAFANSGAAGYGAEGSTEIVVNPDALAGRGSDDLLVVLAHELLHVATRPYAGPFTPTFIEEGFADYVGRDASPGALDFLRDRAGALDGELPQDPEFTTGDASGIFIRYQEANSAVGFFVRRWGLKKFASFYRLLGSARYSAGTAAYHIDRSLRETVGIGFRRFQSRWADSIGP